MLELVIGYDGKIRSVKLKQGNGSVEYHSICNLYPLELSITHSFRNPNKNQDSVRAPSSIVNSKERLDTVLARPNRKATERFHRMFRDNSDDL